MIPISSPKLLLSRILSPTSRDSAGVLLDHMRAFLFYGRNQVTSPLSRARDTTISIRSMKSAYPSLQVCVML